jgi:putative membrane protein
MNTVLFGLALVFLGIAAVIHVYIFYLESLAWSKPRTWKTFGLRSQEDADVVRPMAFNQGYYNVFLAVGIVIGIVMLHTIGPVQIAGLGVTLFAALSMVAASIVLVTSSPKLARAAVLQGAAPLVGSALLILSQVLG